MVDGVLGRDRTGTGGRWGRPFGGRCFALWTTVKGASGSCGRVVDDGERGGDGVEPNRSGEGGGRECGVEGMS